MRFDNQQPDRPRHPLESESAPPPQQRQPRQRRQGASTAVTDQPWLTYWLIGINIVIFALGFLYEPFRDWSLLNGWASPPAILEGLQVHRLLTAMFLHADPAHLLFNMYALFVLGGNVERIFGHTRYALIYFLGGLGGSVLSVMLGDYNVPSIGASGAVFAVWAAEALHVYQHRHLYGGIARRILTNTVIFLGFNLLLGFTVPRIDNWGHIGGFLGGVSLAYAIGPRLQVSRLLSQEGIPRLVVADTNPLHARVAAVVAYTAALFVLFVLAVLLVVP